MDSEKIINFKKKSLHNVWPLLTLIACTIVIVLQFPANTRFKYEYQKGDRWRYPDLISPADIPMVRKDSEIDKEVKKIESDFIPYFSRDESILNEVKNQFNIDFTKTLNAQPRSENQNKLLLYQQDYLDFSNGVIDQLFGNGVIPDSVGGENINEFDVIHLLKGNESTLMPVPNFYQEKDVEEYLASYLAEKKPELASTFIGIILPLIQPNILYDEETSKKLLDLELQSVSSTSGVIPKGDLIISRDTRISDVEFQKLLSLETYNKTHAPHERSGWLISLGYTLLIGILLSSLFCIIKYIYPAIFAKYRRFIFFYLGIIVFTVLTHQIVKSEVISHLIIPFAILPILIITFFNRFLAVIVHLSCVLVCAFLVNHSFEFTFVHGIAGFIPIIFLKDARYWNHFFLIVFGTLMTYLGLYLGFQFIKEANILNTEWSDAVWILLNGILLLLAYPLIPLVEKVVGFTSNITLAELSDLNHPLLKKLAVEAPGTFQHSIQVANLAEAASELVGGNTLLLKVAALYHDVGKLKNPEYFIENQNNFNPHEALTPAVSASKIIDHVSHGIEIAHRYALPAIFDRFILTHHGTTRVEYFYHRQVEDSGEETLVDIESFTYPGPKPESKEEVILMLADSIEASSKSLQTPDEQSINDLVDKIVRYKESNAQFSNANITYDEIRRCSDSFKNSLKAIYHVRIAYPE